MLDLGANTECDAQNLVQFAVMGAAYARTVLGIDRPRVKMLNIGTEELKGTDELKEAAALLREADYLPFRFDGFTEGDQLSRGELDVVVTDGFSGNIALKTAEGTARFVTDLLRRAFKSSLRSKAGFALSAPALNLLKVHLDPNNHNGAVFLGLNGLVVKSHGSATPKGVANALGVAASMVRNDIIRKIGEDLDEFRAHAFANEAGEMSRALGRPRSRLGAAQPPGHRTRSSPRRSTPPTPGSSSAPGSAAATSPATTRRPRAWPPTPRAARSTMPGVAATDIDLIVLATATPDQTFPSSATKVQAALGIDDCVAFDVHAVCTGFLYALSVADSMLRSGNADKGAGDRLGDLQPNPRLGGPRDLRPVRRRRRRAGAERGGDRTRDPRHPPPRRRPPQRFAVRRRRAFDHRHRRQAPDEGPRGVPPRRRQPRRRPQRSARGRGPDRG